MEYICKYCGKICKNSNSLKNHERLCKMNPNHQISSFVDYNKSNKKYKNQFDKANKLNLEKPKVSDNFCKSWLRKHHTDEQKQKISESMKIAHKENRAHNIGESRWNNEPSYPEQWFINVIKNEFDNKNYIREYPFYKYSLDFAWVNEKICVEIDGEQHQRFEEQIKRDNEKDKLLKQDGWKEIRIPWKDCFNNPKYYIQLVKDLFN